MSIHVTSWDHAGWRWVGGTPDPDGLTWRSTLPHGIAPEWYDDPFDLIRGHEDENGGIWRPLIHVSSFFEIEA